MDNNVKSKTAILIDADEYLDHSIVMEDYLNERPDVSVVVFVTDPDRWSNNRVHRDFIAVISNTGDLPDLKFKREALHAIQSLSNIIIAAAIDPDASVRKMYESCGIITTLSVKVSN